MAQWVEDSVLHLDVDLLCEPQDLDIEFKTDPLMLDIELVGGGSGKLPYYTGAYVVDPRKVEQVLETKNKSMNDNVVVHAIYYSETLNVGGGNTAYIGLE